MRTTASILADFLRIRLKPIARCKERPYESIISACFTSGVWIGLRELNTPSAETNPSRSARTWVSNDETLESVRNARALKAMASLRLSMSNARNSASRTPGTTEEEFLIKESEMPCFLLIEGLRRDTVSTSA